MKKLNILLVTLLIVGCAKPTLRVAQTFTSDGSVANIMAIHDTQAVDGDTIRVPDGTFTWTTELKLSKAVSVIGNTITDTDSPDCPNGPGCVTKNTVIIDGKTDGNRLISFRSNGVAVGPRVSGFAFTKGTWTTPQQWALFENFGTSPIRIDHNHVDENFAVPNESTGAITQYLGCHFWIGQRNFGVMDHNVLPALIGVVKCYWGDQSDRGDLDWTKPAGYGGPEFFFVENNWMTHGTDTNMGGKLVVRYNHMIGDLHSQAVDTISALIVTHGIARGTPERRAGRAYDVNNNDVRWHQQKDWDGIDGGSGIFWGNRFHNQGNKTGGIALDYYRQVNNNGPPFGQADGRNAWDVNDAQTHTLLIGLDQPGRGAGKQINRASPAWNDEALEPCYEWDNTSDGPNTNVQFAPHVYNTQLVQGRDYYNDTQMPGYAPYTYPHPLVSGGGASPSPVPTAAATPSPTATTIPTATPPLPTPSATPMPSATSTPSATVVPSVTPYTVIVQPGQQVIIQVQPKP